MRYVHPRRDERAVAPVIAEILLVSITVSIAGVVYFTANNLVIQASVSVGPCVTLMPANVRNGVATIMVAAVSHATPVTSYKVNLQAAGVLGSATPLPALGTVALLPIGGVSYRIAWSDLGGSGSLAGGDPITVSAQGGPLPEATAFTFCLIWSNGAVLQTVSWVT